MDSTTITHTNGTRITTVSTAAPRPLATKISGTAISKEIREEMKQEVMALQAEHGVTPGLAVVLVGNRPDSATYVRMKKKAAAELGFHSVDVTLPDTATTVRSIPLLPKAACVELDRLVPHTARFTPSIPWPTEHSPAESMDRCLAL